MGRSHLKAFNFFTATVLIFAFLHTGHTRAFASLGDNADSVERDRQALRGTKKITTQNSYQIHEITSGGGTVREYLSASGVVFAVVWSSGGEPDLNQLFGNYYQEYENAEPQASHPSRRAPLRVRSENIVVEKSGHMRAILGRAYILKQIPPGVSVNEIQ